MTKELYYPMYIWRNGQDENYFVMLHKPCYETEQMAIDKAVADGFEIMTTSLDLSACVTRAFAIPVQPEDDMGVRLVVGEINGVQVFFCEGPEWESVRHG